ncbi:unnamed protein product [Tuber aestivum]|uniref:Uncharacterized protein n=1 Tax=Tuber aestivum TaxID=59557 RepID=A0A292Q628_9PEZI|nr:unnamed protein product [Tuber aestivum]
MFRILTREAVKAIPRQFRLSTGALRFVHSERLPYSGPATYDTLMRRFSSDIDPHAYVIRKHQQEAQEHGEFIDIHDIGNLDPENYTFTIPDVDDRVLRGEIAEVDAGRDIETGYCYLYGRTIRMIFPAVVGDGTRAHWVFFIVDTAAPLTYLSTQTSDFFGITKKLPSPHRVTIAGYPHVVYRSPSSGTFSNINILGMDFLRLNQISLWNDFEKHQVRMPFGQKWEPHRKAKQ